MKTITLEASQLNQCLKLDQLALNGFWSRGQWEKELLGEERICIGILNESELIGVACGWIVIDELHITIIAVHPDFRRKGIGRKLLFKILALAKKRHLKKATLEVSEINLIGIEFYQHLGFYSSGKRKNYYQDNSAAIILWRSLD